MTFSPLVSKLPRFSSPKLNVLISVLIGVCFYCMMASWLRMEPGDVGVTSPDLVFNVDTYQYVGKLEDTDYQELNTKHLLRMHTWVPLTRLLFPLYDGEPHGQAVKAAVTFNIFCLTLAFALMSWLAWRQLESWTKTWLFNTIHLLSTSSLIMSAPDHFSQSYLLMISAFAAYISINNLKIVLPLIILLGVLIAGTTTSNAAFAGLVFYYIIAKNINVKPLYHRFVTTAFLLAPVIGGGLFYLYTRDADPNRFLFLKFFNFRLFEDIPEFFYYAISSWVYPIVAPPPSLSRAGHLTLEAWAISDLWGLYLIPYSVWLGGLVWYLAKHRIAIFANHSIQLLILWVSFNILFHNVWGDEYILFASHFSFALLLLMLRTFNRMPTIVVTGFSVPILIGQVTFILKTVEQLH